MLALALAGACADDDADSATTPIEAINSDDLFTVDEHVGARVSVNAPVKRLLGERAFVLSGHERETLLVLAAEPLPRLAERQVVQAEGTVREFDLEEYREDFALTEPAEFDPFEDEPVLVADEVVRAKPR